MSRVFNNCCSLTGPLASVYLPIRLTNRGTRLELTHPTSIIGLRAGGRSLTPCLRLPDGAGLSVFRPRLNDPAVEALRRRHGLVGRLVVGVVGRGSAVRTMPRSVLVDSAG
jgi:hypothetical protein